MLNVLFNVTRLFIADLEPLAQNDDIGGWQAPHIHGSNYHTVVLHTDPCLLMNYLTPGYR